MTVGKKPFQRIWEFMIGYRALYVGAILAIGFAASFGYVVPLVLRFVIDSVLGNEPAQLPGVLSDIYARIGAREGLRSRIWIAAIAIVTMTAGNGIFAFLSGKWKAVAAESTALSIREALYDHLQHLSYAYHVGAETGDLIQRCTSDVETVRRFLAIQFVEIGRALFMVAAALPIMASVHRGLTFASLPVLPIILTFSFFFYKRVQKAFQASDEAEGRLSTTLQENLTGVRVVRAFARQAYETEKFEAKNRDFRDITYRLVRLLAGYWAFSEFLSMLQIGFILVLGTVFALNGSATIGTVVVFVTMEGMLLWPVRQMGRILADMGKASVAIGRIDEILTTPRETMPADAAKPPIRGAVEFQNVSFSYDGERKILRDVSFSVPQGATIAILGPTGSGKSTLVQLLARLYDYTSGSVTIDGVELRDIDKKWIRRHVGIVLQEPFLYAKTIRDNIGLGAGSIVDDVDLFAATRTASVHDVIDSFENGYNTLVGERGVTLSGGQKQRVAIARALIAQSPILIFDDSLSAVDNETDATIRRALTERTERATTFIISHRLTTLAGADEILVMEDGGIVQRGTHDQLVSQEGLYKRVWRIQNNLEHEVPRDERDEHIRGTRVL